MKMATVVKKHRTTLIGLAVALMIVGTMLSVAMAQPGPQPDGQDQDGARRGGRDFRGMMMGGGGGVALAVSGDSVFLFTRNTLYKFDAETLELVAQAELPRPERPQQPPQ